MKYEDIRQEFINIYIEQIEYANKILHVAQEKSLTSSEKLDVYRKIYKYNSILKKLASLLNNYNLEKDKSDVIIDINLNGDYLSSFNDNMNRKNEMEKYFNINKDINKVQLTKYDLELFEKWSFGIPLYLLLNNQDFYDKPIYIFSGFYDSSHDFFGPVQGERDNYIFGIYYKINSYNKNPIEVKKKNIFDFEKDKEIICKNCYYDVEDINRLFNEELLNENNKSISDCIESTKKIIEESSYKKSPEYKEKVLLDRISGLYKKVRGVCIKKELLYSGDFLDIVREIYELENNKIVSKEKVVKNKGRNSVIVIGITSKKKYIITFQNRIDNQIIAEFPSGYIEYNETPIDAAKRELEEETGYISNNLLLVDEVYTSPGIDNSITYIVIADDCVKGGLVKNNGNELVDYDLFSKKELDYIFYSGLMKGSMNKLAYYDLKNTEVNGYKYNNGVKSTSRSKKKEIIDPKQLLIKSKYVL